VPDGVGAAAPFERLAIVGLGLIGASIALGARASGAAATVVGTDASADVLRRAGELALCDEIADDLGDAVRGADLVILCVPVGVCGALARDLAPHLAPGAILSDAGSVKEAVVREVSPHLPAGAVFVPAHPIAGTERSGPEAGFAALFHGRWCVLTPPPGTDEAAVARVRAFWERLGSQVETMDAAHHDLVLAVTSHLPHLIAYNIVGTAADLEAVTQSEVIKFSAGGFRDFTRIAASDPTMWRDVFLHNREAVLEMLGRFNEDLAALARAIRWGDGDALHRFFARTGEIRRGVVTSGQDTPEPDFGRRRGEDGPPPA